MKSVAELQEDIAIKQHLVLINRERSTIEWLDKIIGEQNAIIERASVDIARAKDLHEGSTSVAISLQHEIIHLETQILAAKNPEVAKLLALQTKIANTS